MSWLEIPTPAWLPLFLVQDRPAQGFYDGASARLRDMLLFRDVSTPRR